MLSLIDFGLVRVCSMTSRVFNDEYLVTLYYLTLSLRIPPSNSHSTSHPPTIPIENPESTVQALTKSSTSELSYILLEQARGRFF